jgi:DNA-binding transcriptional LysR family regulator
MKLNPMGMTKRPSFQLNADLLTLRTLIAVVDKGSFSAAAKQIGRSQSAVSLQIAKLEDRIQVRLLERTSRSVKQTPAGETFTAYARRIIELADEGLAAVTTP